MSAYLALFGRYLPSRIVTNGELAPRLAKTPEWIEQSSGIRERRYAAPDESVIDMGVAAAQDCLQRLDVSTKVDFLIAASGSASRGFPGPSAAISQALGLGRIPALDLPIASAGSLFALALAMRLTEAYPNILIVASEKMSDLIAVGLKNDANTAILFGDGAGAALVTANPPNAPAPLQLTDAVLHSDGQFRDALTFDGQGALQMDGMNVILNASRKIPAVIEELLARNGMSPSEVSAFILHQANANLITRIARSLQAPPERFFTNIARYGNTSSASMLIAASEWADASPPPGPTIFGAFGAGYHWGAVLCTADGG